MGILQCKELNLEIQSLLYVQPWFVVWAVVFEYNSNLYAMKSLYNALDSIENFYYRFRYVQNQKVFIQK